jgi:hypothetical protein
MNRHRVRFGQGKPLVLFQGLGSTWRSWQPILNELAAERTVIALDLPDSGETSPLPGSGSIGRFAADGHKAGAGKRFPAAPLRRLEECGPFPMWDRPQETVVLILNSTCQEAALRRRALTPQRLRLMMPFAINGETPMASKARVRPSWKRNTSRWKKFTAIAKTQEGQENLAKKKRYANRHG